MNLNVKRLAVAAVATGGIAAVAFGGSAVSTAFSSDSAQTATINTATINGDVSGGTFTASNLVPGGAPQTEAVTLTNTSQVREAAFIVFNSATLTKGGQAANPSTDSLEMDALSRTVTLDEFKTLHGFKIGDLDPAGGANASKTFNIGIKLAQNAGNDWSGVQAKVTYTIHFQDEGGTDANTYVGP